MAGESAEAVLVLFDGLKSLTFYEQRFAKPLIGAYGSDLAPHTYLSRLCAALPPSLAVGAARAALRRIVDEYEHCPAPKEVRSILGASVLKTQQLDFAGLYEKAKLFISMPPTSPEGAREWMNKVIYSAVRHLGRDRFMVVQSDEWKRVVVDAIFGEIALVEYEPSPKATASAPVRRDFKALLGPKTPKSS